MLSVIIGPGSEIGDAFVTHPVPRVISFTGSTPVGRHIAELAAKASIIKRVEFELGGNSPFVVLHDADIDRAVEAAVFGKFLHQGQICMSVNRIIVDDSVYDTFLERFVELVKAIKLGDPDEPDTLVGPIINDTQLKGLLEKIREVIDTITSKVVLILGRFTGERKAVLDALRDELRKRDSERSASSRPPVWHLAQ